MIVRTLHDIWDRQCGKKVRYPNRAAADGAARQMQLKEREDFNAYRCECCGCFHIGHRYPKWRLAS